MRANEVLPDNQTGLILILLAAVLIMLGLFLAAVMTWVGLSLPCMAMLDNLPAKIYAAIIVAASYGTVIWGLWRIRKILKILVEEAEEKGWRKTLFW